MAKTKRDIAIHNSLDQIIERLLKAGADQAMASYSASQKRSVSILNGEYNGLKSAETAKIGLHVWIGQKEGGTVLQSRNPDDLERTIRSLVSATRAKSDNPYALPPSADQLSKIQNSKRLDLRSTARVDVRTMTEQAREMEAAALSVPKVVSSDGAAASWSDKRYAVKTTYGFNAEEHGTSSSLSVTVIAEDENGMKNGSDWSSAIYASDLEDPVTLGKSAGKKAADALSPQQSLRGQFPVVFDPDIGDSLLDHFTDAVNGEAIRKGESFITRDSIGQKIFADNIQILNDPFLKRGMGSSMYTSDGLPTRKFMPIENGILRAFFMDLENARRLGLDKTAIIDDITNLTIEPGNLSPAELIADIKDGLYITELMGQGVNMTSGNYSRGASGFWIKDGAIAFPVAEATIAGNLREIFRNVVAANDLRRMKNTISVPTLRVDGMSIA